MSQDNIEKLFLRYSDITNLIDKAHVNLEKIAIKKRVTAGRSFRKDLRDLKKYIDECTRLSREIDAHNKEIKESKKTNK